MEDPGLLLLAVLPLVGCNFSAIMQCSAALHVLLVFEKRLFYTCSDCTHIPASPRRNSPYPLCHHQRIGPSGLGACTSSTFCQQKFGHLVTFGGNWMLRSGLPHKHRANSPSSKIWSVLPGSSGSVCTFGSVLQLPCSLFLRFPFHQRPDLVSRKSSIVCRHCFLSLSHGYP